MKGNEGKMTGRTGLTRCWALMGVWAAAVLLLTLGISMEVRADSAQKASTPDEFYEKVINLVKNDVTKGEILILFDAEDLNSQYIRKKAFDMGGYELESKFLFWSYTLSQESGGVLVTFNTGYFMSGVHKKLVETLAEEVAEECRGMTDYQKVKYAYDYIILNCEFESSKEGVYNNLFRGRSDRNGYAEAFQTLMYYMNVPCKYTASDTHAWNTVCLNGAWYSIDTMMGDTGGSGIDYTYFLKADKDWAGVKPTEATANVSFAAKDLEQRYEYPNYQMNAWMKVGKVVLIPVGILLLIFIISRLINGEATRGQIARNEDKIRNMYKLPDD